MSEKLKKNKSKEEKINSVVDSYYFKIPITLVMMSLLGWGIYEGWKYFSVCEDFRIKEVVFDIHPRKGVKGDLLEEIRNTRGIIGRGLFEKGLSQEVAGEKEAIPWVKKVHSVRRGFPDKLLVQLEIRKAVAVVKREETFYLLDKEGMVLPEAYFAWPEDQDKLPCIESRRLRVTPKPGQRLEDKGVLAGIELVCFLKEEGIHKLVNLRSVDVTGVGWSRSQGESDIVIWTQSGVAIKWGCPPLCGHTDELSNEQKLKNLLSVVKAEGTKLDQMQYIDVRWKLPRGKKKEEKEFSAQEREKELEGI